MPHSRTKEEIIERLGKLKSELSDLESIKAPPGNPNFNLFIDPTMDKPIYIWDTDTCIYWLKGR